MIYFWIIVCGTRLVFMESGKQMNIRFSVSNYVQLPLIPKREHILENTVGNIYALLFESK